MDWNAWSTVNWTESPENTSRWFLDPSENASVLVSSSSSSSPSPPLPPYDWSFVFVVVFIVAGGVGNILVCLAVCLDRKLQNVTNYFLLSLAIADLLVSLFVMPLGAIPGFLGRCAHG